MRNDLDNAKQVDKFLSVNLEYEPGVVWLSCLLKDDSVGSVRLTRNQLLELLNHRRNPK